jgi:diguanylate cyclase (GGDEF)-like protein
MADIIPQMTDRNMPKVLKLRQWQRDESKDKRIAELESENDIDFLTRLPQRKTLINDLTLLESEFERGNSSHALIYLDIDNFKAINDTVGHPEGDSLLNRVATILRFCVRDFDKIYRVGGDEMVILVKLSDTEDAENVTNLIINRARINLKHQVKDIGHEAYKNIGISAGFALAEVGDNPELIIHRADKSMYLDKAKKNER